MLKYLYIENIAVIEKTNIDFGLGFNVLTGETGAGKSIVIDAINAVLGERTSKELIRNGCETATVSAVFENVGEKALDVLKENDILPINGEIIVKRVLSLKGSGKVIINDTPVTASLLKNIAHYLINIHGQHDNQALLNPDNHIDFIDAVADVDNLKAEYLTEFKHLNSVRKELSKLETDEDEKARKIELLEYQIEELKSADITVGEQERLKKQLLLVNNYEKTLSALSSGRELLNGDDNASGIISLLQAVKKHLSTVKDERFEASVEKLNEAENLILGVDLDIADFLDDSSLGNLNPAEISDRLDLLHKLMLKYGDSEEKLLNYLANAEEELKRITFSDKYAAELGEELDASTLRLVAIAEKLTAKRKTAAEKFSKDVCEVLNYLNMQGVKFTVSIQKGKYTKRGCDEVEFLICANKGEKEKPLCKVASGGELSRIMLAIKSVLFDKDTVDTLIFDEIDTGISGFAADKVGVQLKKVSSARQVICVTHLAQIAAYADNHLLIEKQTDESRTFTLVKNLAGEDRIVEIARIMSGSEMTESIYISAKELLDRSFKNGNL